MAAVLANHYEFHPGELAMHKLMRVPKMENPTVPSMPDGYAYYLSSCPLTILGTVAPDGSPWVSIVGGEPGYAMPLGGGKVAMKVDVPTHDPLVQDFSSWDTADGREKGEGMVAGLGMNLERRQRVKFFGRAERQMRRVTSEGEDKSSVGFLMNVEESLGNCPKYITTRKLHKVDPKPILHPSPLPLPKEALEVIDKSDLLFVASRYNYETMDANHRGGPPGFVRVVSNDENETSIVWPEYSGNRLYQTLGNFKSSPVAGVTIPDFSTGDVIYMTGTVEVLVGKDADALLPRSNLAVKFVAKQARFVQGGLTARGEPLEYSPYNPPVRYLMSEKVDAIRSASGSKPLATARMVGVEKLGSDVTRFTWELDNKDLTWKAGQYVALSFFEELSTGYHHMNDGDPSSLNDDYIRTFTVSSPPSEKQSKTFEITIKKVGVVTEHIFRLTPRHGLKVPLLGFGGEFTMDSTKDTSKETVFVAGGVGITPFLAKFSDMNEEEASRTTLLWSVNAKDFGLIKGVLGSKVSGLNKDRTTVFITGNKDKAEEAVAEIKRLGIQNVQTRRLQEDDFKDGSGKAWYLCASKPLRDTVLPWIKEHVTFEDFGY